MTLPPGRAKLATKPPPTGSLASANTIGMTAVACFVARTALPDVTMTFTLRRTNSAAISAKRSLRPSAQRYSNATVRPSIQPSSCSRRSKAATYWFQTEGVAAPKTPIVGGLPGCCALAASGHAAAPPSTDMNCRLPTPTIICHVPNGIMLTAMWGRYHAPISRSVTGFAVVRRHKGRLIAAGACGWFWPFSTVVAGRRFGR